ncbi:MAG: CHRD domain-containing protein [Acidimicrobiia bacterium]
MIARRLALALSCAVAGVLAVAGNAAADADPTEFTYRAGMNGAMEVPGPGDPNGSGKAVIAVNVVTGEICFELVVRNIAPAAAAHVHEAEKGSAGPIVVTLTPPTSGSSSGCVVDLTQAQAIADDPSAHYANVHNAEFPDGAVRGQLHGRPDRS